MSTTQLTVEKLATLKNNLIENYTTSVENMIQSIINEPIMPTTLHNLILDSNIEKFKIMLELNLADVNSVDKYKNTPLIIAIDRGKLEFVKLLIDAGAKINIQNIYGNTALHKACMGYKLDIVKILVDAGVDLNIINANGDTALLEAIGYNDEIIDIVKILVDAGADLNIKNINGNTVLHRAARNNLINVVKMLLNAGADVNIKNHTNKKPSKMTTNKEIQNLFKEKTNFATKQYIDENNQLKSEIIRLQQQLTDAETKNLALVTKIKQVLITD